MPGYVTVVDFWAPWCGPCRALHPRFDQVARKHAGEAVRFARVNVDASPALSSAHDVMSLPTVIVFDAHGHEVDRHTGVPDERRLDQLAHHAGALAETTGRGAT